MPLPDFSEFVNYRMKKKEPRSITDMSFDPEALKPDEHNTQDNAPDSGFDISGSMYAQPRTEEYLQHLRDQPKHEDYKSSVGRKIAGTALGMLLGNDFGVTEHPLHEATEKWSDAGAGLKEGAQLEQKDVIQRRLRLADMLRQVRAEANYSAKMSKMNLEHKDRIQRLVELGLPTLELKKRMADEVAKQHGEVNDLRQQTFDEYKYQGRARLGQGQQRLNIAQERSNRVPPLDQARVEAFAHKEVAKDPRFAHWYDAKANDFGHIYELDNNGNKVMRNGKPSIKEEMPQELVPMLKEALAKEKDKIVTKHRSNYAADTMSDQEMNDYLGWGNEMPDFLKEPNEP